MLEEILLTQLSTTDFATVILTSHFQKKLPTDEVGILVHYVFVND